MATSLTDGQEIEMSNGERMVVRGGRLVPASEISPAADAFGGLSSGFQRGATNLGQRFFGLDQSDERDIAFRQDVATNPISTSIGQGLAAMVAAAPMVIAAEAAAAKFALSRATTFALTSLGSGAGIVATEESREDQGRGFLEGVGIDATIGTVGGIASGLPGMAGRVARGITRIGRGRPSRTVKPGDIPGGEASVRRLQDEFGIPLTPGQASGSRSEIALEGSLQASPFRGGGFTRLQRDQQKVVNQVAARSIGQSGDIVDLSTLDAATKAIGGDIQRITTELGDMPVDIGTVNRMRAIANEPFLNSASKSGMLQIAEDLEGIVAKGGVLTPDNYRKMRQQVSSQLGSSDGNTVVALTQMLDEVDNIPTRALPEGSSLLAEYAESREQWRNLIAMKRPSSLGGDGDVRIRSLNNNMRSIYGDQVLDQSVNNQATKDLLSIGEGFASARMAARQTSGTAENLGVSSAINQVGQGAGALLSGGVDPSAIAPSLIGGGLNQLINPLHLAPEIPLAASLPLRALGTVGASAAIPEEI